MASKISALKESLNWFRQSLINLIFAPFVAIAALIGLLFISVGYLIKSVESLIGITGYVPNLGGDYVSGTGTKMLPDFYF